MKESATTPGEAHRDRAAFYRVYYAPLGSQSAHGLAVVDCESCVLLYANARYLERRGLDAGVELPRACHSVHGRERPCSEDAAGCPAREGYRRDEAVRRVETALGFGEVEILVQPLDRRAGRAPKGEVLVVEKLKSGTSSEESAQWERQHLATIVRHSADAIVGLDRDWRIRSWNQGAEAIFGYTDEEILGRPFDVLVPGDDDSFLRERREFERRGILKSVEERRRAKDGRIVLVSSTWSLVRDSSGEPIGVSMVCRDVGKEVLLKDLLEHQHRALRVVLEIGDVLHSSRSVDEILSLILLGVTAEQGLGFNRAFLLLVESEGEESRLVGRMAVGPSDAEEAGRIWNRLSSTRLTLVDLHRTYVEAGGAADARVNEIVRRIDVPLSRSDHVLTRALEDREAVNVVRGRTIHDDVPVDADLCAALETDTFAVIPLHTRDRAVGTLIVDNRITGVAISEADLQMLKVFANHASIAIENSQLRTSLERRLEELEHLNRRIKESQQRLLAAERLAVVGEMAARIVHEIRNPLVSIGGFARLLRRGFDPDDPRSDYLRVISDEVSRLERIVQELLDFSKPQSQLLLAEVDANGLVDEVVTLSTVEAAEHGVEVETRYDPSIGTVRIDADKTKQVLLNILRNALEAMVEGGTLRVSTVSVDDDRFRIRVSDTGPGIDPELREKVFEPGYTTRRDGTGFGLAIAKRLVELQGGQISLCGGEPKGCTFDIVMPRRVRESPARESRQGEET